MPSSVLHTVDDVSIDVRALRARTSRSGTMCVQEPQLHGRVLRFVYVYRCPRGARGHVLVKVTYVLDIESYCDTTALSLGLCSCEEHQAALVFF